MIGIGQFSCDFINSLKAQNSGKIQEASQGQIIDKCYRQDWIANHHNECKETGHLFVGKGKGYKGDFVALMIGIGGIGQESKDTTDNGGLHFTGTAI